MLRQRRQGVSGRLVAESSMRSATSMPVALRLLDLADHVPRDPGEADSSGAMSRSSATVRILRRLGDRPSGAWSLGDHETLSTVTTTSSPSTSTVRLIFDGGALARAGRLCRYNRCGSRSDCLAEPLAQGGSSPSPSCPRARPLVAVMGGPPRRHRAPRSRPRRGVLPAASSAKPAADTTAPGAAFSAGSTTCVTNCRVARS